MLINVYRNILLEWLCYDLSKITLSYNIWLYHNFSIVWECERSKHTYICTFKDHYKILFTQSPTNVTFTSSASKMLWNFGLGKILSHFIQGEDHLVKKFAVRDRRACGTAGVFSFEISNRKGGLLGDIAGNVSWRQTIKKTFSTIFLE